MHGLPPESDDEFEDPRELLRAQYTELATPAERWLSRVVTDLRSRGSRSSWTSEAISALPGAAGQEDPVPPRRAEPEPASLRPAPQPEPEPQPEPVRAPEPWRASIELGGLEQLQLELPRLRDELAAVAAELGRLSR